MKIFADTNVLVSAFTARGLCADLLEIILADHQLMKEEFVVEELQRVLVTKVDSRAAYSMCCFKQSWTF